MTVQADYSIQTYEGNGETKVFTIPFKFFNEEIAVYKNRTYNTYEKGVDYLIQGGEIVFKEAPKQGESITIVRSVPLNQLVTFIEGEDFPASDYEYSLDRIVMALQEMWADLQKVAIPPAEISVKDFVNNYYNKQDVDNKLNDYYTKEEVDEKFAGVGGGTVVKRFGVTEGDWQRVDYDTEYPYFYTATFPDDNYVTAYVTFPEVPAIWGGLSPAAMFNKENGNCTITIYAKEIYPKPLLAFAVTLLK